MPDALPPDAADGLAAYLSDPSHGDDTLGYQELHGFLFAVAAGPDPVPESRWLPQVFGGDRPDFRSDDEARRVTASIRRLHDDIQEAVENGRPTLPGPCAFLEEALDNLEEDAPVARWSRGFLQGHLWLRESWDPFVPEPVEAQMATMLLVLGFFSSREMAEAAAARAQAPGADLSSLAEMARQAFPDAMAGYAHFGRTVLDAWIRVATEPSGQGSGLGSVAGEEPCPCGSGDPYRVCCGAA